MSVETSYPLRASERNAWIIARRGAKNVLAPHLPYAFLWEEESDESGNPASTATLFLTNRECPYRCLMCDLWRNTLDERVPSGAIAAQIRQALSLLPPARQIKLYNAGSFFDPAAIPPEDYAEIAEVVQGFERVIVESHPHFIGDRTLRFQELIAGRLEVAIGLETAHPGVLERLNKRFTVPDFQRAAQLLKEHDIALRVFLLVGPPFLTPEEDRVWTRRSLDTAFDAGATACCLIPTRGGNGAMDALARSGEFAPPSLQALESAMEYGLRLGRGRVFADLWDIESFATCSCSSKRTARLAEMNRTQCVPSSVVCAKCGAQASL